MPSFYSSSFRMEVLPSLPHLSLLLVLLGVGTAVLTHSGEGHCSPHTVTHSSQTVLTQLQSHRQCSPHTVIHSPHTVPTQSSTALTQPSHSPHTVLKQFSHSSHTVTNTPFHTPLHCPYTVLIQSLHSHSHTGSAVLTQSSHSDSHTCSALEIWFKWIHFPIVSPSLGTVHKGAADLK